MMMTDDDDLAGAAIGILSDENDRLRARNAKMLTACKSALEYFERCVEPSCDEGDELEDGTIHDGRTHEGNLLRAAVASTESDAERRRRLGMPAERGRGGSGDETLIHDLECNHAAVNRPGASIYSRAMAEIEWLREERDMARNELDAVRDWLAGTTPEPPWPETIARGEGHGEWHGFEAHEDGERFVGRCYRVESWIWHPSSKGDERTTDAS